MTRPILAMYLEIRKMKKIIAVLFSVFLSVSAFGEPLTLEKRQADAAMNITSLILGDDESVISVEGDMGEYGRVYATWRLRYDGEGKRSGTVHGSGRGATGNDIAVGNFSGHWEMIDGTVTMRNVVALGDGTMNLDVITFRPVDRTLIVSVYVLK
jgi:hypothetical protein